MALWQALFYNYLARGANELCRRWWVRESRTGKFLGLKSPCPLCGSNKNVVFHERWARAARPLYSSSGPQMVLGTRYLCTACPVTPQPYPGV